MRPLGQRLLWLLRVPIPAPPDAVRRGPFRHGAFSSPARSPWLTSRLGIVLGVCFGVCFVTGLLSHTIQHPPGWFWWPSRPVALYRFTQGLHVATGLAVFPILSIKVWSVYPKLFSWPPARTVGHALERLLIVVLMAAALFQLVTGLLNVSHWYSLMPWGFLPAHYWTAWLVVGAILVHVATKLPVIQEGLRRTTRSTTEAPVAGAGLSRRGVLVAAGTAMAAVTLATVGQTVRPLSWLSLLAPRRPDIGPQGLPVNMTAIGAGVTTTAQDPGYRLVVSGPAGRRELRLDDLAGLPQHTADLPITCVEGWSAGATWTGVRLSDLVALAGGSRQDSVLVESLQEGGYRSTLVDPAHAADPLTLLATRLNGEPLHLDHGYPCRLIAPNRPGVLQTKWVASVTVMAR
jgi:DMSO/TMAO reductase YedYZ molybdopterin-dependent catalytic subunit